MTFVTRKHVLACLLLGIAFAFGCASDAGDTNQGTDPVPGDLIGDASVPGEGEAVSFEAHVYPLLQQTCGNGSCHINNPGVPNGGLDLSSATGAYQALVGVNYLGASGCGLRVSAGDASASQLYLKMAGDPDRCGNRMPPTGGAVSAASLELVRRWIDEGAQP